MYFPELESLYKHVYPEHVKVVFEIDIVLKSGRMVTFKSKPTTLPSGKTVNGVIRAMNELLQQVITERSHIPFEIFDGYVVPTEIAVYSIQQVI